VRRILGHALGATAIALLLVVLCVPALARTEVAPLAAPEAALPKPPEKSPGRTHQAGVRALPLTPPDGLVAREFPSGRGLDDVDRVRTALEEVSAGLGLQAVLPRLLEVQPEFGEEDHYPYTYAPHDTLIQHALRPDLSPADRRAAVDAATLTIVLATHHAPSHAATIGYSLLRAVRDTGNTCDVQTGIAYLVAIGTTPDLDHIRVEVAAAEQLCPIWNSSSRATATTGRSTAPTLTPRPTRRI
jgi:hypothetical protein